jgi:hypothetical protein
MTENTTTRGASSEQRGAPPPKPEAVQDMPTPGSTAASVSGGVSIAALQTQFARDNITGAAKEFMDQLTAGIKTRSEETGVKTTIEPLAIPSNGAVYMIHRDGFGIVVLFDESLPAPHHPPGAPKSAAMSQIVTEIGQVAPKTTILQTVIVKAADYKNVNLFVSSIHNKLLVNTDENYRKPVAERFSNDDQLYVNRSLNEVREFIAANNPHGVMPRTDIGVMVNLGKRPAGWNSGQVEGQRPLVAVGGFVEIGRQVITRDNQHATQFFPIIRITSVVSNIPLGFVPLMGLAIAADQLLTMRGWVDQFYNLSNSVLNLGALLPVENGKLQIAKSHEDVDKIIASCFGRPVFCLDLVDGELHDQLLEAFHPESPANPAGLLNFISYQFGAAANNVFQDVNGISQVLSTTYHGAYSNGTVDTRHIDYLMATNSQRGSSAEMMHLLDRPTEPAQRADLMRNIAGDWRATDFCTTVMLHPNFLAGLQRAVKNVAVNIISETKPNIASAGAYTQEFADYGNLQMMSSTGRPTNQIQGQWFNNDMQFR